MRVRVRGGGGARGEKGMAPSHTQTHLPPLLCAPPASRRRYNFIGPAGAAALAPSLAKLTGLATLDLWCAGLTLPLARSATLRERGRSSAGSHG